MARYYILAAFTSLLALSACSNEAAEFDGSPRATSAAAATVVISEARIRPPLPGQKIAAGYFTLNSESGDKLLAVSSDVSARVELHHHINDGGIMRMRRLEAPVLIPAGGRVEFKPGGYHIMLFDAQITEQTQDVALTFDFETADNVTIIAEIMTGSSSYGSGNADNSGTSHGSGETKGEEDKKSYGSGH